MKFRRMGSNRTLPPLFTRRRAAERGSILVYIVMAMVIFGLLGALMVSLFSTSVSSSATANESRRAFYLAESGLRYGMSELRNRGFSDSVIDPLNQTLFNLPPSGAFDLNVLTYWFEFASGQDIPGSGSGTITVDIPKGEIPQGNLVKRACQSVSGAMQLHRSDKSAAQSESTGFRQGDSYQFHHRLAQSHIFGYQSY